MSAIAEAHHPAVAAYQRAGAWARAHPYTIAMLGLGLIFRLVAVPLASGGDFNMWNLTAAAALHGRDTYANPPLPISKAGPYAYFPLYLYILMPLKWLALHTSVPYLVLGKLPVLAGDIVVACALLGILERSGRDDRDRALGAGLFFLNPMVLYNGPFYGRFDSLCLAALLLAWRALERPLASGKGLAVWYAVSVTLKTFPIFLVPYLLRRAGLRRGAVAAVAAVALPLLVSLPYLIHDAGRFLYIVFQYDSQKGPRQFAWQLVWLDLRLTTHTIKQIGFVLLALFALVVVIAAWGGLLNPHAWLPPRRSKTTQRLWSGDWSGDVMDPYAFAAMALTLFLLLSKVVYEQYFLWPLPFLAVLVARDRLRSAGLLLAVLSTTGLVDNLWFHPFGLSPGPALWVNGVIAAACLCFVIAAWQARSRMGRNPGARP